MLLPHSRIIAIQLRVQNIKKSKHTAFRLNLVRFGTLIITSILTSSSKRAIIISFRYFQ